jgi:basic membrane protein A
VDQSGESETVITSAMKGLGTSVYDMIAAYYNGSFPGGENKVYDAANNGVALAMDTAKFDSFAKADYDTLFAALQNNTNNIASDILKNVDADNNEIALTDIPVKAVVVTEVK